MMSDSTSSSRRSSTANVAFAIVFGCTLYALALFWFVGEGWTGLSPDGWAYWQGAYTLFYNQKYAYFSGAPIVYWPPGYSLYLSAFGFAFGFTGLSLLASNAVLIIAQSVGWGMLFWAQARSRDPNRQLILFSFFTLLLSTFIGLSQGSVLAHNMLLALFPYLVLFWQKAFGNARSILDLSVLCLLCMVFVNTHNTGLAAIFSLGIMALIRPGLSLRERFLLTAAFSGLSLASWFIVRSWFGLAQGHHFGSSRYSAAEYLEQIVRGFGHLWGPESAAYLFGIVGLLLALILLASYRAFIIGRYLVAMAFLIVGAQFILFNLLWVNDPSTGRFLWIPFLMFMIVFFVNGNFSFYKGVDASLTVARVLGVASLIFSLSVTSIYLYRAIKWSLLIERQWNISGGVPVNAILSLDPPPGQHFVRAGQIIVRPPAYRWEIKRKDQ